MTVNSIISFGISSALLLIFSCILLKAPKLYSELSSNINSELVVKPKILLSDRHSYGLEDLH